MNKKDRLIATLDHDDTVPRCELCKYFVQHYTRNPQYPHLYNAIRHGHCTEPRCKDRSTYDVCERYAPKND